MVYVEAEPTAENEYVIPVTWEAFSRIKVQANSLEEAYEYAQGHIDDIPIDDDWDYVDGSYRISADSAEECKLYNS